MIAKGEFGGATEETMFPDLGGLARSMVWELQERGELP